MVVRYELSPQARDLLLADALRGYTEAGIVILSEYVTKKIAHVARTTLMNLQVSKKAHQH
jgi:hypothetical protein